MSAQTAFDLRWMAAMGRGDFIVAGANADAAAMVARWRDWPQKRLALVGPEGAGKTHLAHVFRAETGAALAEAADLTEADAPALCARGAVIENADHLPQAAEPALFHLMNLAAAEAAPLLLTGREPPARWAPALPDLASRLGALTIARLDPPDDTLLAAVIGKLFADRGLKHEPGLPGWLALRIERSFAAAAEAVARLDRAALQQTRRPSRAMARAVLPALSS